MIRNNPAGLNKLKRFLLYGTIGLIVEVIYTGLDSLFTGDFSMYGKTFLVMLPIYGLAVWLEPVHDLLRPYPRLVRGLIYLSLIWTAEYFSGLILQNLLGACPWHYSGPLAIDGLITLKMAPEWFLAGLGFEYLHDFTDRLENRLFQTNTIIPITTDPDNSLGDEGVENALV